MSFYPAGTKIFEGHCTIEINLPNGSQEKWEYYTYIVYIVDGRVVIYNDRTNVISIMPVGTLVSIHP